MKLIDLSKRERNPDYYDRSRDIETALAWNAIKKSLTEAWREELFPYIKSVKVTDTYITINTGKPIVNNELQNYSNELIVYIEASFSSLSIRKKRKLRLI